MGALIKVKVTKSRLKNVFRGILHLVADVTWDNLNKILLGHQKCQVVEERTFLPAHFFPTIMDPM
jgi:hypothetical protein